MIDLHTHTILSDGELIPAEHIRRAQVAGYRVLGLADHGDLATMASIIPQLIEAAQRENELGQMVVLAGIELTHVRPAHYAEAVARARDLGAQFVIAHGETIAEPVDEGTNRAAIEAGVDILAHPGLITPDDVKRAAERGVRLEISAKGGHCLCNGHVARLAREHGARLAFGSDSHTVGQFVRREQAIRVLLGAGLSPAEADDVLAKAEAWARSRIDV